MKTIPTLKANEIIRVIQKLGFEKVWQKGSHLILFNPETRKRTVVPVHKGKDIKKNLLQKIIEEDCGITTAEFLSKLKNK